MSDKDLEFKPLSEGLGFHPFSNGLPYTPAAPKPDLSRGSGAVAAGSPSFAFPRPQTQPQIARPAAPVAQPAKLATQAVAAPAIAEPSLIRVFGWDYVGRRFFAYFVDSSINVLLGCGVLVASLWPSLDVFATTDALLVTFAFLIFFNWALTAAQEVAFGTTIGKKLFGLRLQGGAIALLFRALLFMASTACLGTGVLWCVLDSDHRGLHDIFTGIQPEEY